MRIIYFLDAVAVLVTHEATGARVSRPPAERGTFFLFARLIGGAVFVSRATRWGDGAR